MLLFASFIRRRYTCRRGIVGRYVVISGLPICSDLLSLATGRPSCWLIGVNFADIFFLRVFAVVKK